VQEKEFQFNLEEEKKLLKRREDKLSVFFQNFVSNHFERERERKREGEREM